MSARLRPDEAGLLWALAHHPVEGLAAVGQLQASDLEGLVSAPVLQLAASLVDVPTESLPALLRERLSEGERALFDRAARAEAPVAIAAECALTIKRDRLRRELAAVQDEIDRLASAAPGDDALMRALWAKKKERLRALEDAVGQ